MESLLEQAHKANSENQKNMKRYQETIRELQQQIDEEKSACNESHNQLSFAERRGQTALAEKDELAGTIEQVNKLNFFLVY